MWILWHRIQPQLSKTKLFLKDYYGRQKENRYWGCIQERSAIRYWYDELRQFKFEGKGFSVCRILSTDVADEFISGGYKTNQSI